MASRSLLKRQIDEAWKETIEEIYSKQLINSERGLQVHFCHRLLSKFTDQHGSRRIFIEPCFKDSAGKSRSPDVVICHTRQIIGVLELKYLPRASPKYKKDLATLTWFGLTATELTLSNDRYLGVVAASPKKYSLAPDAVLCWAGVYRAPKVDIKPPQSLERRFLCLHAVTSHGQPARLFRDAE
jgi:hypothetical protein